MTFGLYQWQMGREEEEAGGLGAHQRAGRRHGEWPGGRRGRGGGRILVNVWGFDWAADGEGGRRGGGSRSSPMCRQTAQCMAWGGGTRLWHQCVIHTFYGLQMRGRGGEGERMGGGD